MASQLNIDDMDSPNGWYVYILCCHDGTLYTGITNNLERRVVEHNSEKGGSRYTRTRKPVRLVYAEPAGSRSRATKREILIKKMPLAAKHDLIETWKG